MTNRFLKHTNKPICPFHYCKIALIGAARLQLKLHNVFFIVFRQTPRLATLIDNVSLTRALNYILHFTAREIRKCEHYGPLEHAEFWNARAVSFFARVIQKSLPSSPVWHPSRGQTQPPTPSQSNVRIHHVWSTHVPILCIYSTQ